MARYRPPAQSKLGQIVDVIVLLALTFGALYLPLYMGLAGRTASPSPQENPTWESLGQNEAMVERWNALGYADPTAAQDIITSRFDYSFGALSLIVMVVVVVGYFVLMFRLSDREYREVIAEKFGRE
ncbi:hypothetical protein [Rubellimicrobium roseum]|uniref:Uncharacterized protein n=1 Tax=Rubellimicrobium roseum TaxID=687525 RepID=A0A5C4NBP7_9RHOB|nr:hypothetical protein [Rubellimicrobium roseum]TNC72161.1 hypothetical protein FHG71_08895 [Rubellimicrobium roseum]